MNKTLRLSFALKNTYRVNSVLYSLKQIPLIKKVLPEKLYQVRGLKIFANLLTVIWEVCSVFLGKFLYFFFMIMGAMALLNGREQPELFLHILFFLSVTGSFTNTFLFDPSKDKYYALVIMRMNARAYTLVNYTYAILKLIIGFLPFGIVFGLSVHVPLWQCLLLPFFVTGLKFIAAAFSLWKYERTGRVTNENMLGKADWIVIFILLAATYGLPAIGIVLPGTVTVGAMILSIVCGAVSIWKILAFDQYRVMYKEVLANYANLMDSVKTAQQTQNKKMISTDAGITSSRRGFEYLNELFIKRHQKILWKSVKRTAGVCLCLVFGIILLFYLKPEVKEPINRLLLTYLPYFVFIMYAINRGTGFTNALFMNCDRSLLTYSFYKQPKFILKLFQIRLREIIKINLLPAFVIGAGLSALLYLSGGTDNPLNYAVIFVSILFLSAFFSVHYLTIYYLLQPYNAGTEIKSGTYQIVLSGTYLLCFFMMMIKMPTLVFGLVCIVFCVIYFIGACALIYSLAPKTFRLRN